MNSKVRCVIKKIRFCRDKKRFKIKGHSYAIKKMKQITLRSKKMAFKD